MPGKSLVRKFFFPVFLILLAALAAAGGFAIESLRDFYYSQTQESLRARAQLLRPQLAALMQTDPVRLQARCRELGADSATHITLVRADGQVLCDSQEDPARLHNYGGRPEIQQALSGQPGTSMRFNDALKSHLMYVAVPLMRGGKPVAAVRAALPLNSIGRTLDQLVGQIAAAGLALALVGAAAIYLVSRRIGGLVAEMKTGAVRLAEGDLSYRLPMTGSVEFDGLSRALNDMAKQLHDRIHTITEQGNEQQAILTSMVESVFAVDSNETVIHLNQAAARLFGIGPQSAQGRPLEEVVRNTRLQEFVKQALASRDPVEADVEFAGDREERYLQVRGTVLRNARNESLGAVFVLNDVTRLRRLETMRRDFVANVSHELKTPITSIKGFVETLLDGALDSPEDTRRFLGIVSKQAERLNAIIEDLLSLSRIEQESERHEIVIQDCRLREVLENAIGDCGPKAVQKEISLHLICDHQLMARVNPPLLEEAVVNLVDNAIKYSDTHKRVDIHAGRENGGVVIRVADQGRGIDRRHLPRLFERFYRVDKARSRSLGGTGLGLAIVKHIAQAHGGNVAVESTPGVGSIFTLHLPGN